LGVSIDVATLVFDADGLARAQLDRELEFLDQIRGRIFHFDERLVIVANFEDFRRYIGATGIALAGMAIHYDFHSPSDAI
jgi:hypothetical protein